MTAALIGSLGRRKPCRRPGRLCSVLMGGPGWRSHSASCQSLNGSAFPVGAYAVPGRS